MVYYIFRFIAYSNPITQPKMGVLLFSWINKKAKFMGKHRNWMAYLSISASGPEFSSKLEEEGHTFRPRSMADLRYTTADIDFLEPYFQEPNVDSGDVELHKRLLNPTVEEFYDAFQQIQAWLKSFKDDPDWDGGGIHLCYAGHGRKNDGALVLENGFIEPRFLWMR